MRTRHGSLRDAAEIDAFPVRKMHNEAVPVTLDGIGGHIVRIRRIVERLTITRERWEMERIGNGVQNQLERAVARKETA